MRTIIIGCLLAIVLGFPCRAQEFPAVSANPADSRQSAVPAATLVAGSPQAERMRPTFWPHPYIYGGLALSQGASYSPTAGTAGAGLNVESQHFIGFAEGSLQNAHKQDSDTGTETDLKARAFLRTTSGWFFGGGAQWSRLDTAAYGKQAWRPVFGVGKDLSRENLSMRAQVLYVLPGTDRLNAVQGPEISLWMPSPASRSHFFYRQILGIYEFHQTSVPGSPGASQRYAATFMQFTAMCRF